MPKDSEIGELASGPRVLYQARCAEGLIRPDPAQERAVERLEMLHRALQGHAPPARGWLGRLGLGGAQPAPKGLYLWGPVGRGKSMLMDLFFATAPTEKKRRVHFQAFMAETHALIGRWRDGDLTERRAVFGQARGDDPIAPTAALIASRAR